MSKKIIYLLSLLMALSLVFASCKKTTTDPNGGILGDEPGTIKPPTDSVGSDGLFTDKSKLDQYSDKAIQASQIAKYKDKNYMRNPVITVVGDSTVVVFYEVRYQSPGSANDTALTGTNTVDIAYTVSTDAGISFDTSTGINYVGGKKATGAADSHGAPVVFYDKTKNKLVVVASAGIGLGVGSYTSDGKNQSKLEYSVADVTGGKVGTFSAWKEITVDLNEINKNGGTYSFKQYGTHAARGVVATDGKLLLPVVLGNFIYSASANWGNSEWGYVLFEGSGSGNEYTFTKKGNTVKMVIDNGTKASRIVSGKNSSDYVYVTVSDRGNPVKLYSAKNGAEPKITSIKAHDGAAGTLIVSNWIGGSYDPNGYDPHKAGKLQALLSHVQVKEAELAIRLVDENFTTQQGGSFIPDEAYKTKSKSSSLDILKDGTIVMAAEGGQVPEGVEDKVDRPFYIHFYRFSQAYIASQTK